MNGFRIGIVITAVVPRQIHLALVLGHSKQYEMVVGIQMPAVTVSHIEEEVVLEHGIGMLDYALPCSFILLSHPKKEKRQIAAFLLHFIS